MVHIQVSQSQNSTLISLLWKQKFYRKRAESCSQSQSFKKNLYSSNQIFGFLTKILLILKYWNKKLATATDLPCYYLVLPQLRICFFKGSNHLYKTFLFMFLFPLPLPQPQQALSPVLFIHTLLCGLNASDTFLHLVWWLPDQVASVHLMHAFQSGGQGSWQAAIIQDTSQNLFSNTRKYDAHCVYPVHCVSCLNFIQCV